jgi:hypothetical protein
MKKVVYFTYPIKNGIQVITVSTVVKLKVNRERRNIINAVSAVVMKSHQL